MEFIFLMVSEPTGFWQSLISFFESFIFNYAWAIIVLTICIKIILTPLDFFNKKVARDNMRMQTALAPQLARLQKQYGGDRAVLNQKTQELYKSSGYNIMGSCFIMLLNLILTMVIFLTLFGALNSMSSYKIEQQYLILKDTYDTTYTQTDGSEEEKVNQAQNAVLLKYDEIQDNFLWIRNVWVADNPWTSAILPFNSYLSSVGDQVRLSLDGESVSYKELSDDEKENFKNDYEKVMLILNEEKAGVNGYLITAVLAIVTSFLSQYLMQKHTARKNAKKAIESGSPAVATAQTNKILLIILPIIMGIITLFYNAVFGLYIIAGQVVSLATFPIIDKLLDIYYDKKDKKLAQKNTVDYSRKN